MRPIVNLEGRTVVLGALRQAEKETVLGSVAETFDKYVLTMQDLAGPRRTSQEPCRNLAGTVQDGVRCEGWMAGT